MNERLVWIDCEMTGLDYVADALIEIACVVTDFDLNPLGEGVDLVIKPPPEAVEQMDDFVRSMHERSGLITQLDSGITLADAEEQVLAYVQEHCPEGSRPPLAGNTVATDRAFISRDMPTLDAFLHYRIVDVSSIKELSRRWYPRGLFRSAGQAGQPPRPGRHPREHRGAEVLPGRGLRAVSWPGQRRGEGLGGRVRRVADGAFARTIRAAPPIPAPRLRCSRLSPAPAPTGAAWWV